MIFISYAQIKTLFKPLLISPRQTSVNCHKPGDFSEKIVKKPGDFSGLLLPQR